MPELPEVETVRRGLEPAMSGQMLEKLDVRRFDLRWPIPSDIAGRVSGTRISRLRRRSKYLMVDLDSAETILIHLGMSGRMLISGLELGNFHHNTEKGAKHDHVVFHMGNGATVTFNDPRRFGMVDIARTDTLDSHRLLKSLGPEPLGNSFHAEHLKARLKGKATNIKAALLDQTIVSGLGNIYVCEALHRSRISPLRKAGSISMPRLEKLVAEIRRILEEAIESGGSSLKDHRQTNGDLGYFQHNFRAYDREGEDCPNSQCSGRIRRISQSGRSTYYCPSCQR